jgi:hypothetical protein
MSKVIIELEFNDKPNDADVYNYLNELMDNDCLSYEIKEIRYNKCFIVYNCPQRRRFGTARNFKSCRTISKWFG